MEVLHVLALLLMLMPLVVTTAFTFKPTDAVYEKNRHSNLLPHDILELGHESYSGGINQLVNELCVSFNGHR
jgi:hypothetical protein